MVALTCVFLFGMVARRSKHILNVGSTAGFQPGPFMAIYYASKTFVNSFTDPTITPDAANPGFAPFGIRNINGKLYVTC